MDVLKSLEREEDLRGTKEESCRRTDSTAIGDEGRRTSKRTESTAIEDEGRQAVGMLYLRGALPSVGKSINHTHGQTWYCGRRDRVVKVIDC